MDERQMALTVAGDGLLGSYVSYARRLTAAPLVYHLATGLAVIAGAAGSHISFMGAGDTEYWPNQYSLMLGPSGVHKTTAMNIGIELLRRAVPGVIYSDQFSLEAFVMGLRDRPSRVLAIEEFATLLSDMERSYLLGLKETLTKLFDPRQEFVRSLRGDGEIRIMRPALTIIAASTPEWLTSHLKEVDFISGFMPRFLLWPSDLKEDEPPGGALALADTAAKNALILQIGRLSEQARGRIARPNVSFNKAAVRRIESLRREYSGRLQTESIPKELSGLYNRCSSYAAKIAALLVAADNGAQEWYEIDGDIAGRACLCMEWLIDQAGVTFETVLVMQAFEREAQALLRLVPPDGIAWSLALKRSRIEARKFASLISTLIEREQIQIQTQDTATRNGRVIYRSSPIAEAIKARTNGHHTLAPVEEYDLAEMVAP